MATRRKKLPDDADAIEGIPELESDEQFVSETATKRTVRKEKIPVSQVEAVDAELFDEKDDDGEAEPEFSENSIAALIYNADDEPLSNQFCTVAVRRNPDGMNDRFATPCASVLHLPRLVNIELAADKADIEDRVRSEYGGGHYFFQIHYNNRLASSWKSTLADLPVHLRAAKVEPEKAVPVEAATVAPANPFDQFFDTLKKQREMKELLFGEEQRRLESEIERLRAENANRPPVSAEPKSEKLILLEHALQSGTAPTLQDRLLTHLFPEPEESNSHWLVDLVKTGFEHKEELVGIAQMLLGGMMPAAPKPQGIESFLRQPAPVPQIEAQPPRSNFRRRPEGDAATIDNDIDSNNAGLEAAESNESSNANGQVD